MVDEEQNHAVLSLIVSQLKEFGYYSAAKTIADSIGRNPDASNKLLDLLKDQNLQVEVEPVIKEIPSDFFQYDKTAATKQCPPFTTWFTTQHREGVRAAAFSYDGTFIATGSHDTSLKVLDADAIIRQHSEPNDDKKVVKTLYDHTGPVNEVKFHPNGAVLASCSDDFNIKFFDLQKQNTKRAFRYLPDAYPVKSIAFHPSGEYLLSGSDHHAVRLFDIQTMKCFIPQSPQDHHKAGITKVRYAPNGSTFASASIDGSIKIYDTVTGKCVNSINKAHGGASVIGLEYSRSSNYLLTTGLDSKGFLWDLGSGKVLCSYLGAVQKFDHAAMVFDYNEDFVIGTDGATQNIIFWDVNTGEIVRKVRGVTENPIRIIAASPTDHGFLTGGDDCRGRYWNLQ